MATIEAIDDDLTEAGFTDAIYTSVDLPFAAASARDVAMGYCLGTAAAQRNRGASTRRHERVVDAVAAALERRFGTGPIERPCGRIVSAAG